jgi:hypothetical protein
MRCDWSEAKSKLASLDTIFLLRQDHSQLTLLSSMLIGYFFFMYNYQGRSNALLASFAFKATGRKNVILF